MPLSTLAPPGSARPATDATHEDPVRASQHTFRQALDALANPGTIRQGNMHPAVALDRFSGNPYLASILLALLDHEVSLHVEPGAAGDALASLLIRRTRVSIADVETATFVVADAATIPDHIPEAMNRGSLSYPDDGAMLVLEVASLDQENPGVSFLRLTGPGIETSRTLRLHGVDPAIIESRNRAVAHYPMGIDLLLIDDAGRIAGVPRTTVLELRPEGDPAWDTHR
jgi:alpha-D-ribose 1-methylphosphonate 5-triphosphate synthase subunit PhnH